MVIYFLRADIAQQVERILGKDEVTGSNPVISSIITGYPFGYPVIILPRQRLITGFDRF